MPDAYSILGPPTHLYQHYRLDGPGIAERVAEVLEAG
jgi:transketolase